MPPSRSGSADVSASGTSLQHGLSQNSAANNKHGSQQKQTSAYSTSQDPQPSAAAAAYALQQAIQTQQFEQMRQVSNNC